MNIGLVFLLIGLAALLIGMRGGRIDDHPICRRCRFDLFGHRPGPSTCPECGADLARSRSTKRGHRRRHRAFMACGVILLTIGLVRIGVLVWVLATGVNLHAYKPAWLVTMQARNAEGPNAVPYLIELHRRVVAGRLSAASAHSAVAAGLELQDDADRTWQPEWGYLIGDIEEAELITDEQWLTFLQQGTDVSIRVRQVVHEGEPLPVEITVTGSRLDLWKPIQLHESLDFIRVGDRMERQSPKRDRSHDFSLWNQLLTLVPLDLPPGSHDITMGVRLFTRTRLTGRDTAWTPEFVQRIEVVPADVELMRLVPDSGIAADVRESIKLSLERSRAGDTEYLACSVQIRNVPVNVAFDVIALRDGIEYPCGSICAAAGTSSESFEVVAALPRDSFDQRLQMIRLDGPVDVMFRPSPEAARRIVDLVDIWDGVIVFENVPVARGR